MATDLSLVVLGPQLHRGHMVEMLRHHRASGFYERTPAIAEMNQRIIEETRSTYSPIDTFKNGVLRGHKINSVPVAVQAAALAPRYRLASREVRMITRCRAPFLTFVPFMLDAGAINSLTGYVARIVYGFDDHEDIVNRADDFFVKHYGYQAFLCEE